MAVTFFRRRSDDDRFNPVNEIDREFCQLLFWRVILTMAFVIGFCMASDRWPLALTFSLVSNAMLIFYCVLLEGARND